MTENDRGGREGFLARWSDRKRAVRDADEAEKTASEKEAKAAEAGPDEEELSANRAAAEAIDLDSLKLGSDMTPFYKPGVPAALKLAALRKLWRSDPLFAVQDGLDIYRENFNDPSYLLKGGASSWVPGSGYAQRLAELKEQARQALAQAQPQDGGGPPAEAAEPSGAGTEQAEELPAPPEAQTAAAEQGDEAGPQLPGETAAEEEEAEPAPRVPLRSRLDFSAFKDAG